MALPSFIKGNRWSSSPVCLRHRRGSSGEISRTVNSERCGSGFFCCASWRFCSLKRGLGKACSREHACCSSSVSTNLAASESTSSAVHYFAFSECNRMYSFSILKCSWYNFSNQNTTKEVSVASWEMLSSRKKCFSSTFVIVGVFLYFRSHLLFYILPPRLEFILVKSCYLHSLWSYGSRPTNETHLKKTNKQRKTLYQCL